MTCGGAQKEGSQAELNRKLPQLDARLAEEAFNCAKDDRWPAKQEAVFIENKGFCEKEASVYAKLVWYFTELASVYA